MSAGCGGGDLGVFEGAPGLVELAAGGLFAGGVDEAEFADGEVAVGVADGRAEGAAGDGAGGVEVAGSGGGVEDGAGLVVGEVVEGVFVVRRGKELAGGGVAGEAGGEVGAGGCGAVEYAGGKGGFGGGQGRAEGFGVERGDGEDADAALVAARVAGQPGAGAGGGGGECGFDLGEEVGHGFSVGGLWLPHLRAEMWGTPDLVEG